MAKSAKTSKSKKATSTTISCKQYGRNIVMIIDGEKYSRAFNDAEEREEIKSEVEKYNKRASKKRLDAILNTMLEFEKQKEEKQAKVKEAKKGVKANKKAEKPKETLTTEEEIAQAKAVLEKHNYTVAKTSPRRRSGEY